MVYAHCTSNIVMKRSTWDGFIELLFAAFQWMKSFWTSDGESVKEGLAYITRSGSEDYSHSEKLHLCRKTSGHYRWGRLTLSSAVWCGRLMQSGTTNCVQTLEPASVLMHTVVCARHVRTAHGGSTLLVLILIDFSKGWCHFLPCRGVISLLHALRALRGVIRLW